MSGTNTNYQIIREYKNLYTIEEMVRKLIHSHLQNDTIPTISKERDNEEVSSYE